MNGYEFYNSIGKARKDVAFEDLPEGKFFKLKEGGRVYLKRDNTIESFTEEGRFCGNGPYSWLYGVRVEETQLYYTADNMQYGKCYLVKDKNEKVIRDTFRIFRRFYEDTGETIIDNISNLRHELFYI